MKYRYRATETFWENFYRLAPSQKESARRAWEIFKHIEADTIVSFNIGTHAIYSA